MGAIIFTAISCLILGADAILKAYTENSMEVGDEKEMCGGKIFFRRVHNKGMILNAFDKYPRAVKYASAAMGILLTVYNVFCLCKKGHTFKKLGLAMLTGGAWSNIYDRLVRGYVVDFIGFQSKKKRMKEITYNIGDFFIFAGGIVVVLATLFHKKK